MDWQSTIGVAVPRSGETAAIGESVVQGVTVAASETEDPAVRIEDTAGDPERARAIVEEMINDGIPIVIGPISSDVGLAVRDLTEEKGVPHLPAMCGNPKITRPKTRYTFRFASSNRQSAHGTLRFFRREGVSRVAIVAADFSYPHAVVEHLREYAPEFGIKIGAVEHLPLGTTDFSAALSSINADIADGIFLPYPGNNATTLIRQLREEGLFEDSVVVGDYSYGSRPYHRELGPAIEGTHSWAIDTISESSQRLSEKLGEAAGVYHCFGYDIAQMAISALNRADRCHPEALRDVVAATEYDTVSGWGVRFDANGVNEQYRMRVNRWIDLGDDRRSLPVFRSDPIVT